jgi:hypothetical protein
MRSIAMAFVAALVAAPALSAQQATEIAPAQQVEAAAAADVAAPAAAATVAPVSNGLSDLQTVRPNLAPSDAAAESAQVDTRTRNILAVVGAVVIVLALLAFL